MRIAVVGATGMVGEVMLKVLAERNFPVTELIPVASERSVGKEIEYKGKKYKVVGGVKWRRKKMGLTKVFFYNFDTFLVEFRVYFFISSHYFSLKLINNFLEIF